MNAGLTKLQIAILAILFVCVCCELTGMGLFVASTFMDDATQIAQIAPSPTPLRFATFPPTYTPTPNVTKTPAPTNTRVVDTTPLSTLPAIVPPQRTPTTMTDPYKVVVPTPTAPTVAYPIGFNSTLKIVTYQVTGKTPNDISKSLEANALSDPHEPGSRFYALTKWQLSGNWATKPSTRGCEVTSGEISVVMTMTLPLLTTTGVPPDTLKKFNTFVDKTVLHESGHVELVLQGARDYQRTLGNFAPVSDCEGLKAQLSNLYRRSFDTIDAVNVDYDVKTKHGLTQGAVFP